MTTQDPRSSSPDTTGAEETAELVRSVAISSARLWEEVLERLVRVERSQAELTQVLSRLQASLPAAASSPALASASPALGLPSPSMSLAPPVDRATGMPIEVDGLEVGRPELNGLGGDLTMPTGLPSPSYSESPSTSLPPASAAAPPPPPGFASGSLVLPPPLGFEGAAQAQAAEADAIAREFLSVEPTEIPEPSRGRRFGMRRRSRKPQTDMSTQPSSQADPPTAGPTQAAAFMGEPASMVGAPSPFPASSLDASSNPGLLPPPPPGYPALGHEAPPLGYAAPPAAQPVPAATQPFSPAPPPEHAWSEPAPLPDAEWSAPSSPPAPAWTPTDTWAPPASSPTPPPLPDPGWSAAYQSPLPPPPPTAPITPSAPVGFSLDYPQDEPTASMPAAPPRSEPTFAPPPFDYAPPAPVPPQPGPAPVPQPPAGFSLEDLQGEGAIGAPAPPPPSGFNPSPQEGLESLGLDPMPQPVWGSPGGGHDFGAGPGSIPPPPPGFEPAEAPTQDARAQFETPPPPPGFSASDFSGSGAIGGGTEPSEAPSPAALLGGQIPEPPITPDFFARSGRKRH